jgi:hypothetical protein
VSRYCSFFAALVLLAATIAPPVHASDSQRVFPPPVQQSLEIEDWPAVLTGLAGQPLTNSLQRLVVARALFETGRLPEDLFAWFHHPGPDLLSTGDLNDYVGLGQLAETLLQIGHLNTAERLAFDSLELEGEGPPVLRTLARVHAVRGLARATDVFLNRLRNYPQHAAWVSRFRTGWTSNSLPTTDSTLPRIHTNLVTRDRIAAGLSTERLLKQALEANPENPLAFQFLVAHQLLGRQLLNVRQTLASSPQTRTGPLRCHYAEAVLLHRHLYPGIPVTALLSRVPEETAARFRLFQEMMNQASVPPGQLQSQAWRDHGNTYWYYYNFGQTHLQSNSSGPEKP